MTQEAIIAQSEIRAAQAVAVQAFVKGKTPIAITPENPGGTQPTPVLDQFKGLKEVYRRHANKAYKHAVKLQRERLALQAWYRWLERRGPTAVREVARTAYALNMQGYDDLGDETLRQNIEDVLAKNEDLLENRPGLTQIEGFGYGNEGARREGVLAKVLWSSKPI
jgi:hypothetical protein